MLATGFDQTGAKRRNVAFVIDDGGRVTAYTKRHHIPGLESGYTVGEKSGLLGARRAVAICKDLDFQRTLRGDASAAEAQEGGLGVMLVPAWDFGADGWWHARMAIMRGVEGGYAIVRAASNGLVTISDAHGRVVARRASSRNAYASVIADVAMGGGETTYLRIGDAFAWIMGALGLMLLGGSFIRRPAGPPLKRPREAEASPRPSRTPHRAPAQPR
jgi:apolipoprotein N-acyltransferase